PGREAPDDHGAEQMSLHDVELLAPEQIGEPQHLGGQLQELPGGGEAEIPGKVGDLFRAQPIHQGALVTGYYRRDRVAVTVAQLAELLDHPGGASCARDYVAHSRSSRRISHWLPSVDWRIQ